MLYCAVPSDFIASAELLQSPFRPRPSTHFKATLMAHDFLGLLLLVCQAQRNDTQQLQHLLYRRENRAHSCSIFLTHPFAPSSSIHRANHSFFKYNRSRRVFSKATLWELKGKDRRGGAQKPKMWGRCMFSSCRKSFYTNSGFYGRLHRGNDK